MRLRTAILTAALCLASGALSFAADANIGTWKLNEGKSTIAAGAAKNSTVVYEQAGDSIKVTIDGTTGDGKPFHSEWTGKYDGKDYPATGDPSEDTRTYTKIDDHTLQVTVKKGSKVVVKGRVVVAADGQSRTFTSFATDPNGKKLKSVAVYDKQ